MPTSFWAGANGVYRQPLAGGASELWTKTFCVTNLRVVAETVYWSCYDKSVAHRIASAPVDLAFTFATYTSASKTYAVDSANLYHFGANGIYARPLAGGPSVLRVTSSVKSGRAIATDGSTIFWGEIDLASNEIPLFSAPKEGGAPIALWRDKNQLVEVVRGGTVVYMLPNTGEVFRLP